MRGPFLGSSAVRQALVAAALMMAWQIAGKATRDGLFLSSFPPTALPAMIGAAAISSILMAVISARLLRQFGPSRLIPAGFAVGAVLHGGEWMFLSDFPRLVAVLVYIHVVALGSALLSGFWALANERFDPREARRRFGHITAAGTLGSLAGGVLAERVASLTSNAELLLLLAVLQMASAVALFLFAPAKTTHKSAETPSMPEVISGAPYLIGLASLVVLAAMSASMLDYLFKSQAYAQIGRGAALSRFFAVFYAASSVVTFGFQMVLSRAWLKHFGPGRTVAALPVVVTGASLASLAAPGLIALTASRGIELLLRGSLYRSGYELFYTPMPQAEKRSIKSMIDVGAERSGDGLAGATIQLLLTLPANAVTGAILALTAAVSGTAAWLAFRLDRAYVTVLEKGLVNNAVKIAPEEAEDALTQSVVLRTMSSISALKPAGLSAAAAAPAMPHDPALRKLAELRAGDPLRVRAILQQSEPLEPILIPQAIELLDRDDVAQMAYAALSKAGDRIAGQLVDTLAVKSTHYKIRKRIPKVLACCNSRAAWDGLMSQLRDERFEIRVRCAKGLEKILQRHAEFQPGQDAIFEIVGLELSSTRKLSSGASQSGTSSSGAFAMVGDVLRERASKNLAHIFTLLGLVLPAQPVRLALRALRTQDPKLHGVALEYLDSVLPRALRDQLSVYIEAQMQGAAAPVRPAPAAVQTQEALANLLESRPSIMARLEELGFDRSGRKTSAGDV